MDPFQELLQECKVSDGNRDCLLRLEFDIPSFALLAYRSKNSSNGLQTANCLIWGQEI